MQICIAFFPSSLLNSEPSGQEMEVTKKSTDRWVDKEELLPVQMEYELVKK